MEFFAKFGKMTGLVFKWLMAAGGVAGLTGLVLAWVLWICNANVDVAMYLCMAGVVLMLLAIVSMLPMLCVAMVVLPIEILRGWLEWLREPHDGNRFVTYLKRAWKNRGKSDEFNNVMIVVGFIPLLVLAVGLPICHAHGWENTERALVKYDLLPCFVGIALIVGNLMVSVSRFDRGTLAKGNE